MTDSVDDVSYHSLTACVSPRDIEIIFDAQREIEHNPTICFILKKTAALRFMKNISDEDYVLMDDCKSSLRIMSASTAPFARIT